MKIKFISIMLSVALISSVLQLNLTPVLAQNNTTSVEPITFPYQLTEDTYNESDNLTAACVKEFGEGATLAEWKDIKKEYGGNIEEFVNRIGQLTGRTNSVFLTWGTYEYIGGNNAHYLMTRYNGTRDTRYPVNDSIDKNYVVLSSAYGVKFKILVKLPPDPALATPTSEVNMKNGNGRKNAVDYGVNSGWVSFPAKRISGKNLTKYDQYVYEINITESGKIHMEFDQSAVIAELGPKGYVSDGNMAGLLFNLVRAATDQGIEETIIGTGWYGTKELDVLPGKYFVYMCGSSLSCDAIKLNNRKKDINFKCDFTPYKKGELDNREVEPNNNTASQLQALTLGTAFQGEISIVPGFEIDSDYYKITFTKTTKTTISNKSKAKGNLGYDIQVISPDGKAKDYPGQNNMFVVFEKGTSYVKVTNGVIGNYELLSHHELV